MSRETPAPPLQLGPYRTLKTIGRGGMGSVYLAERVDGEFRHRVAVKVVPRGLQDEEAVERFRRERQILARLEHPGIARLLDGGVSADGRPYLAMEYVEGQPLGRHCDQHRLGIGQRLRLFLRVCEAVEHAHQNLIVHCDLKPSNVLVDPHGAIKLLDFGIAALLGPEAGGEGSSPGALTLEYASPEQMRGQPVTTASDVYGLGVILSELLGGHRPYRLASRTQPELERALAEQEPLAPSAAARRPLVRVDTRGKAAETSTRELADRRGTTREALSARLRGDLDAICRRAVEPEPGRRYPDVGQLRGDIENHLGSRPVSARAPSRAYRAGRFAKRHRVPLAAGGVSLLAVLALGIGLAVQSQRLAAERDRARRVAGLFVDLFDRRAAAPSAEITARDLLDAGLSRIDALDGEPELQAQLLAVTGRVYQRLGLFPEASPLLERALALRRRSGRSPDPSVAESTAHLGRLRADQADFAAAERLLREALETSRALHGNEHAQVAELMSDLGGVLQRRGTHEEAETLLTESLALRRRLLGEEDPQVADGLDDLGMLFYARGDYPPARSHLRQAAELRRRHYGAAHPLLADTLNNLASVLGRLGEHADAEAAQRETLSIRRSALDPGHPSIATSLNNLALILYAQGRPGEAVPLLRESLALRRERLGNEHADTAQSLSNLGLMLQTLGSLAEAELLYVEALEIRRRAYGAEHVRVAQSLNNLGQLLQKRGQVTRAEALLRDSSEMLRRVLGSEHPMVASGFNNLASLLDTEGRGDEAEALYREALAIRRRALPADHPHTAYALDGLGRLLLRLGRLEEARSALEEAASIRSGRFGDHHPETARVRSALGEALIRLGESAAGRRELEAAQTALEAAGPGHESSLRRVHERLALLETPRR